MAPSAILVTQCAKTLIDMCRTFEHNSTSLFAQVIVQCETETGPEYFAPLSSVDER